MPRGPRITPAGFVYHVLNRRNERRALFFTPADYENFLALLAEAARRFPVRLLAYCLMPNHWHLVLWPERDDAIPRFVHRVSLLHARRVRLTTNTLGHGHLYQGRYRSFPVQTDRHYWRVLRYVEANPLRASLVAQAEAWRWSSLSDRDGTRRAMIVPGPLAMPDRWLEIVNTAIPGSLLERLRVSAHRGRPFGSGAWIIETAHQQGLERTLREAGGQRVFETALSEIAVPA
jgi:putative transposase